MAKKTRRRKFFEWIGAVDKKKYRKRKDKQLEELRKQGIVKALRNKSKKEDLSSLRLEIESKEIELEEKRLAAKEAKYDFEIARYEDKIRDLEPESEEVEQDGTQESLAESMLREAAKTMMPKMMGGIAPPPPTKVKEVKK